MTQPEQAHSGEQVVTNLARSRLANQGIANPTFAHPEDVVRWLGALQAQDYRGSLWSIGLRTACATEHAIEQAIARRAIVRTWPMRGTLHFVAAGDVRWMLALLTPRVIAQAAGRSRQLGLDEATFAHSKEVFARALQGGKELTRDELHQHLDQAGISPAGQRGYHILVRAAQDGLICFGAPSGKQQTFTLLDEWVPLASELARDASLAELARRYFTSHGPALLSDFATWAGLTVADAKLGIELARAHLAHMSIGDRTYWLSAQAVDTLQTSSAVHLLPGFDEYLLGYTDRSAVLDAAHAQKIHPGANGMFSPTIVVDGKVTGTWKRTFKKTAVAIETAPFRALTPAEARALSVAADRYGEFLGLPVVLSNPQDLQRSMTERDRP